MAAARALRQLNSTSTTLNLSKEIKVKLLFNISCGFGFLFVSFHNICVYSKISLKGNEFLVVF